jgi:hypothetical protein
MGLWSELGLGDPGGRAQKCVPQESVLKKKWLSRELPWAGTHSSLAPPACVSTLDPIGPTGQDRNEAVSRVVTPFPVIHIWPGDLVAWGKERSLISWVPSSTTAGCLVAFFPLPLGLQLREEDHESMDSIASKSGGSVYFASSVKVF